MRYGLRYQLYVHDIKDVDGQVMLRPIYRHFSTSVPRVVGNLPIDARDVVSLEEGLPDTHSCLRRGLLR